MASLKEYVFREFNAVEVCDILRKLNGDRIKIGLPLINYYVKTGIVIPTGKGVYRGKRKFSFTDLVLFYWLFKLKQEGVQVKKFKEAFDILRKKLKTVKDALDLVLATDGEKIYLRKVSSVGGLVGQVLSGKTKGQYVWIFGFKNLTDEVKAAIGTS